MTHLSPAPLLDFPVTRCVAITSFFLSVVRDLLSLRLRCTMLTAAITSVDQFRVEVSGWDEEDTFFVEKTDLAWDEFAGKHISLRRMLPDGAIVFVRVLQATASRPSPPMAYKVEFIGCDPAGLRQFRLNLVQPRYSQEAPPVN